MTNKETSPMDCKKDYVKIKSSLKIKELFDVVFSKIKICSEGGDFPHNFSMALYTFFQQMWWWFCQVKVLQYCKFMLIGIRLNNLYIYRSWFSIKTLQICSEIISWSSNFKFNFIFIYLESVSLKKIKIHALEGSSLKANVWLNKQLLKGLRRKV